MAVVALGAALAGCYLRHERPGGVRPTVDGGRPLDATPRFDVALRSDGSTRLDSSLPPDAGTALDAPPRLDGPTCGSSRGVVVRVEPVTADRARCDVTRADGVAVYGVDSAPLDDGIRVHADFCPFVDADCRCDIVVQNVGADLADLVLIPRDGLIVDVGPTYLSVQQVPTCECLGCPCSLALVLQAADGLLDVPPFASPELDLSAGALVCPEPAACVSATWWLHAASLGVELDVPVGEDRDLGIVHVRSVRDVDIFAPCAACASCGSPQASWVAWVRH